MSLIRNKISKIHRLGKPLNGNENTNAGKPRPLVVKFTEDTYRDIVFKSKKNLKQTGIVISELLTQKRSLLLKKCYERIPGGPADRSIWTDNGRILVKKAGRDIVNIIKESDIDLFLETHSTTITT